MTGTARPRTTNEVLGLQIIHIDEKLDTAIENWDKVRDDTTDVKICMAVLKNQVDDLRTNSKIWDIGNSALGLTLAAVLAYFGFRD